MSFRTFLLCLSLLALTSSSFSQVTQTCGTWSNDESTINCTINVIEQAPDNTLVFDAPALVAGIHYIYGSSITSNDHFTVTNNRLYTSGSFNREDMVTQETASMPVTIETSVTAVTASFEYKAMHLTIHVIDLNDTRRGVNSINDNPPVFTGVPSGVFNISEQETDGPKTHFLCSHNLLASDPDEGPNGTIANYMVLSPPNTFSVSPDSNRVCLNSLKALDRETNATITIILLAVDNGTVIQRNGSLTIILTLLDTNDNSPVFINTPPNNTLMVLETASINTTLFNYTATDADEGSNAKIFFHLQSSSQVPFGIHDNGSLYVNGGLDADKSDCTNPVMYTFNIIITNTDNVNDPVKATSPLTVTIDSVVENPPDVSFGGSYGIEFVEGFNNLSWNQIYRVDNKECNTNYAAQIIDGSQYFEIHVIRLSILGIDSRGIFVLQAKEVILDREATPVIEVLMLFTAIGLPKPLNTTVRFNVTLLDINDNPPSLTRTTFSVDENVGFGFLIDSLPRYFEDPDNGTNSTYGRVVQLTGQQWISVTDDSISGVIRVSSELDYESLGDEIMLNITLYDAGVPPLSSNITLIINLIDVNDNPPVFVGISNGSIFNISENQPPGSQIAIIQATDRDSGLNSNLTYSLLNSTFFVIDPLTGQLDSAHSFDREETSEYMIDILVRDRGTPPLSSLVSVRIKINDLNDNPPSFENKTYQFNTSTDKPVGAIVGIVRAVDPDSGENAVVHYRLISHIPYFEINLKGEISISETLPQDDGQVYNITVEACNPDKRMNSTAEVQIIIIFIPSATPTASSNSDRVLMYIAYGAPALFIALLFAIITTACLICYIRCYRHHSRDLYKCNDLPPPLKYDFPSLTVSVDIKLDDIKLSSTDPDPKHGGGGGNRRN